MLKYLAAIGILLVQETVLQNGLLVEVHKGLFSPWIIHILFIGITCFDIWIGYTAGLWIKKKWPESKFVHWGKKLSKRFHHIGKIGQWTTIALAGYFNFPYINGFAAAWIDEPFWKVLPLILIGDILEYITLWLIVLGVSTFSVNPYIEIPVVAGVWFLIVFIGGLIKKEADPS